MLQCLSRNVDLGKRDQLKQYSTVAGFLVYDPIRHIHKLRIHHRIRGLTCFRLMHYASTGQDFLNARPALLGQQYRL